MLVTGGVPVLAGRDSGNQFGVKVTRETAGRGRPSENVLIWDRTYSFFWRRGQNVNRWSPFESEEEATWCKEGFNNLEDERWFHPEKQKQYLGVAEVAVASKSLASTVYGPVIWPLFLFKLPLLLHGPLSAVRDFRGVGVTGEFPALSHRFLLILQSRRECCFHLVSTDEICLEELCVCVPKCHLRH